MAAQLEKPRDLAGGVMVMAMALGFFVVGRELEIGSSFRMGPGYFPTILSGIMFLLGAVMAGLALRGPTQEGAFGHWPWLALVLVIGAIVFFGITLRGLGLAPVIFIVVLVNAWGSRYATVSTSLLLALGIAAFTTILFVRLLGLPLPLVGPWLSPAYWSPPAPVSAPPAEAPATPPAQ
jgi:hypothetical protein